MAFLKAKSNKGVTLVELLVALAIAALLMLGVIAAFQTAQRTAAIGEARDHIYQNARVALDLIANEIKNAYIDNRNRDFIFVSADGLAGRGNSILELENAATIIYYGLGNTQTPHGIDPTGKQVFWLYSDKTFGNSVFNPLVSIKAIDEIYNLYSLAPPGPPDRLDFTCLTSLYPGNATDQSRLAEVRYIICTETFVDDADNDYDGNVDETDSNPPGSGPITGLGDLISLTDRNPNTSKIQALSLFQLRRALDIYTDKNPFSSYDYLQSPGDPFGRYPDRNFEDFRVGRNGENVGSYIYDLQFEFYGKIAIALDSSGAPEVWGVGWGYQDGRGEDVGLDGSPQAVGYAETHDEDDEVTVTKNSDSVIGEGNTNWSTTLNGGMFFLWKPDSAGQFDVMDPLSDVYIIESVDSVNTLTLDRPYAGLTASNQEYRIIEPTQANGILDPGEDLGSDGIALDTLDDGLGIPNNVSNNDGNTGEKSVGENNMRLDSRVMGVWDSRSPDPRNPRRASELDGVDTNGRGNIAGADDDGDIEVDDTDAVPAGYPEVDDPAGTTPDVDETNDLIDNDGDGVVDDRFYEPAGKPEGVDEPDEADPGDDSLPKAVRITITVSDPKQTLKPIVLSTTVWLSTAK